MRSRFEESYTAFRAYQNEVVKRSRARSRETKRKTSWVTSHPDLSAHQRRLARLFLKGKLRFTADLEPRTREIIRQHLAEQRAYYRARARALLDRLRVTP